MEKMKDLKDLLTHEVEDLISAEKQIIEALPKMIDKAKNQQLKKALQDHLKVTETHKSRNEEIIQILKADASEENTSLLANLFKGGEKVCKGMQGLIKEGEKIINADMNPQVVDAAIIACAQKIEHYEICGYGTLRAYADELKLSNISRMLEQTLNEEYAADDLLTSLAVGGGLNEQAEDGRASRSNRTSASKASGNGTGGNGTTKKSSGAQTHSASKTTASSSSKNKSSSKNRKERTTANRDKKTTRKAK